jgi:hypothetical protein
MKKTACAILLIIGFILLGCQSVPVYYDAGLDVEAGYIDIMEAQVTYDDFYVTAQITMRELPSELTFNSKTLEPNYMEYEWSVRFDTDMDSNEDYRLSLTHVKWEGNAETQSEISEVAQAQLWKVEGDSSSALSIPVNVLVQGNSIILSFERTGEADASVIGDDSAVTFYAYHYNGVLNMSDELDPRSPDF